MSALPKISIVTPSFNQAAFLEETIKSILDQEYPNLEYIIIDGGSADISVEIIKKYQDQLTHWESEKDRGQSHAINKGFHKATGDLIAWLNSDDLYTTDTLKQLPDYFQDAATVLVFGLTQAFGRGVKHEPPVGEQDISNTGKLIGKMAFSQPSMFFRKTTLDKVGYLDERLHYGMDYDLVLKLFLQGDFKLFPRLLAKYRFHSESKSSGSLINFARDWAYSFSKLLRSLEAYSLIAEMEELGLYYASDQTYEVNKSVTNETLQLAFLYFLAEQTQMYYGDRELEQAKVLSSFIKTRNRNFFKRMRISPIFWRSRLIPKFAYQLLDQ